MMAHVKSSRSLLSQRLRERGEREKTRDDHMIWGVPVRLIKPRLILLAAIFALVSFGFLMVYSSSSVTALTSNGDALYYLKRQLAFSVVGVIFAVVIVRLGYRTIIDRFLKPAWVVTLVLLLVIWLPIASRDTNGAYRWIALGPFTLQPSEFAKITVILTGANLMERYFRSDELDWQEFKRLFALGVLAPLALILLQPDKGTVMVLALTLLIMAYFAGCPAKVVISLLVLGLVAFFVLSFAQPYSRARLLAMLDPWKYQEKESYQLVQGFYAFSSGGVFGLGIGMSRQKYSYLPMAHNDFIFAVIGEECGLIGTIGVIVGFLVVLWAGFKIARYAPDAAGQLVALGCSSMLAIQMLLNVCGVIGIFPLSGKPIPFISYGGSSIMSSIMLVGLIFSVSCESGLSLTELDGARQNLRVRDDDELSTSESGQVGEVTVRSARLARPHSTLRLVGGGRTDHKAPSPDPPGRVRVDSSGRRRIDLGPSASERLRSRHSRSKARRARDDRRGRS